MSKRDHYRLEDLAKFRQDQSSIILTCSCGQVYFRAISQFVRHEKIEEKSPAGKVVNRDYLFYTHECGAENGYLIARKKFKTG